ncbi:MAG: hypothetical protein NXI31_21445 [bacterium]|nr:hypothetical protein [bacterium]
MRKVRSEAGELHVKTYDYPTWRDRWRGALRFTGPGRASRATREFDALQWLRAHLNEGVEPVGVWENRRAGFLTRAVLITHTFPGRALDELLAETEQRTDLAIALGHFVGRLHAHGFRDGNLDLRNLLAGPDKARGSWQICKIDSPRYHVTAPGRRSDTAITRDWDRLRPQLEPFGIVRAVLQAAGAAHDDYTREHRSQ